jgi:nifR3 family TIM-barrel protein
MAGITNAAYRRLCAEQGAGLYVCEMITSRGLVEGDETTRQMLVFDDAEQVRSVQLYGTDPVYVGKAVEILCAEHGVAHVDLNFGCPVPKVTRKGGGGALPWKRGLLGQILEHAVTAAAPYDVPVTMKTRTGLDEDHLTYLDAGRIAQESGCAAIALHGRTVAQAYSGAADWDAIAALVDHVDIPVLGNGDIWEAADATRMVEQTGAAGVVVGRGCLGRPWLFRDLAAAFAGEEVQVLPPLGEVRTMMRRHAELLSEHMGEERGCKEFRKHVSWYLKGFRAGGSLRHSLALVDSLAALDACWTSSTRTSRSRSPSWVRHGAGRARRAAKWCCRRGGWTIRTGPTTCSVKTLLRSRADNGTITELSRRRDGKHAVTPPPQLWVPQVHCGSLDTSRRRGDPARSMTPVSKSKGPTLWQNIATSGRPMPASSVSEPPRPPS